MFTVTTVPTASSDAAIHPLIGFAVDIDVTNAPMMIADA